jgi:putative transcriptional regulator
LKNRIEELRNLQNLTQEDFANLMQVSRQTISSLENGKYNPSIFLAYKISKFFNLSIEDVFIFEENSEEK